MGLCKCLCLRRRTPCDDDPFVVARREAIFLKFGYNLGQLEFSVDEIAKSSALARLLDADLELLFRKRLIGELGVRAGDRNTTLDVIPAKSLRRRGIDCKQIDLILALALDVRDREPLFYVSAV